MLAWSSLLLLVQSPKQERTVKCISYLHDLAVILILLQKNG